MKQRQQALRASLLLMTMLVPALGHADNTTKKECVTASTEGQVARDESKLLEAREHFLVCARDECPKVVKTSCAKWLGELEERLPSVVVRLQDAEGADLTDVEVKIDGKPSKVDGKPVFLNPGPHVLVAEDDKGTPTEKKFLLGEGERSRLITVRFAGPEGEPSATEEEERASEKPRRKRSKDKAEDSGLKVPTGAWILGGVGVVALGSFGYFGLTASKELDDLRKTCSPSCEDSQTDSGRQKALIADISLGVSVVALASAVTWTLLAQPSSRESDSEDMARVEVRPLVGGGAFASIGGRY